MNGRRISWSRSRAIRAALTEQGVELKGTTRAETAAFLRAEIAKYAEAVKLSGAKVD